jgi:hypothetical protein
MDVEMLCRAPHLFMSNPEEIHDSQPGFCASACTGIHIVEKGLAQSVWHVGKPAADNGLQDLRTRRWTRGVK